MRISSLIMRGSGFALTAAGVKPSWRRSRSRRRLRMSPPFQSESDLIKFLDSVDDEIKNSRGDLDRRVSENLDLYRGKQWKGKAAPSFMFNVIEASIEDKNGKLSETKPEIMVLPSSNGLGPVADLLTQVVTSIWDKNKVEYKTERLAL